MPLLTCCRQEAHNACALIDAVLHSMLDGHNMPARDTQDLSTCKHDTQDTTATMERNNTPDMAS